MIDEKYLDTLVIHIMNVSHQRAASGEKMTVVCITGRKSRRSREVLLLSKAIVRFLSATMCSLQAPSACLNIGQMKKGLIR